MHNHSRTILITGAGLVLALLAGCTSTNGGYPPSSSAAGAMSVSSTSRHGGASTASLLITTLHADQTLTLPATIGYQVAGPTINATAGYRLRVQADSRTLDLPITAATGTIQLPLDKFLAGRRDLTFTLLGPAATTVSASAVTIHNVLIIGPK